MAYDKNIFDKTAAMLLYLVTKKHSFSVSIRFRTYKAV